MQWEAKLTSVIVDEGDDNPRISVLFLNIRKVYWIGKASCNIAISTWVFIFWLQENDWTTVRDLCFGYRSTDVSHIIVSGCQIVWSSGSKLPFDTLKPTWKTTSTRFSIDILQQVSKCPLKFSRENLPVLGEQWGIFLPAVQQQRRVQRQKRLQRKTRRVFLPIEPNGRRMKRHWTLAPLPFGKHRATNQGQVVDMDEIRQRRQRFFPHTRIKSVRRR